MSFFGDFTFFGWLILAILPAIILGLLEKPLKYYTLFASLALILGVFISKPAQLFYLILYYLIECAIVQIYFRVRKRYGRQSRMYHVFLVLAVLPLCISKVTPLFSYSLLGFLGISYLTFRVAQVIIETYDGVIEQIPLLEFTSYLLFFPCISSGPIDRSRRFHEDYIKVYPRREYMDLLGDGLFKILLGMVYKFVLAGLFDQLMEQVSYGTSWYATIGYTYTYGFHMFFDFAGYSLMAVGASYIFGIRTPDNFKLPFISKDIKDFWDRWHITLSHWFRDFIFSRFMMTAIKKKWFKTRLNGAACGFIVNMLVMGLWHGLTLSYILYGLYHGLLLAVTEVYQKKVKFYKKNKNKLWYQVLSWFLTLQFVMFGFLIFSGKLIELITH